MKVMSSDDLVRMALTIAQNYKTLYVYSCFGAPMNDKNKKRYSNNCDYNKQPDRKKKILDASYDTFGFDCVNLIKGILWGWCGDVNATYGGAVYKSNGVPDTSANGMFNKYCYDKSNDFSNLILGELVWLDGHIGIYAGNDLVVECTPIWKDGVQITTINKEKKDYNYRKWTSHGKCEFIEYSSQFLPDRGWFQKGDSGDNVKEICDFFADKVKGDYFGDYLEACVKVFQKQNGLEPDGCIGQITLNKMIEDGFIID